MTRQTLVYPFPLDEGYMVQLVLPRNLSELEAARLCEFIKSLIVPTDWMPLPQHPDTGETTYPLVVDLQDT